MGGTAATHLAQELCAAAVIPKSKTPSRIVSNLDVLNWEIPEEDYKRLNSLKYQASLFQITLLQSYRRNGRYTQTGDWHGVVSSLRGRRQEAFGWDQVTGQDITLLLKGGSLLKAPMCTTASMQCSLAHPDPPDNPPGRLQSSMQVWLTALKIVKSKPAFEQRRMLDGVSVANLNPKGPYKTISDLWDGEVPEENLKN